MEFNEVMQLELPYWHVSAIHLSSKQKDEVHKKMVNAGKELTPSDKTDLYDKDIDLIDFSEKIYC